MSGSVGGPPGDRRAYPSSAYEMDGARVGQQLSTRPPTQVVLAHADTAFAPSSGSAEGFTGLFNAQYYEAASGAHVFAAGIINWPWGLDRPGVGSWGAFALDTPVGDKTTLAHAVSAITVNVLNEMLGDLAPPPDGDAGAASAYDAGVGTGADPNAGADSVPRAARGGGCAVTPAGEGGGGASAVLGVALGLAIARVRHGHLRARPRARVNHTGS